MWLVEMAWIPFFAAGVINGLGHWWGYRNFETPDAVDAICRAATGRCSPAAKRCTTTTITSRTRPASPMKRGELDPGYWYFSIARSALGLREHQAGATTVSV